MIKALSYCTDDVAFHENRILDENITKRYPGTLWVSILATIASKYGVEVVTGDVAISNVRKKKWKPSEILVIQEQSATQAIKLLKLGAVPLVLVCAESPLYIPNFYSSLPSISAPFRNRILFRGAFSRTSLTGENHVLHFPSFNCGKEIANVPWHEKKFLVMVSGNKYWKVKRSIPRKLMASIRDFVFRRNSKIPLETVNRQLHDRRLALIEYFGHKGRIDLYGTNWDSIYNLPENWQGLKDIIERLKPVPCVDKQEIISRYKYAICLENMEYPGYVTEKIIDCFAAGVIPVYLGAPDVVDFVPVDSFIDLRKFVSFDELNLYLETFNEEKALSMINVARAYLKSDLGLRYSHENWAASAMTLLKEHL